MKKHILFLTLLTAVVLFPLGCAEEVEETPVLTDTTAVTTTMPSADLAVNSIEPFGEVLTDASGRAVYIFTADTDSSTCYDACAQAWPPVIAGAMGGGMMADTSGAAVGMPMGDTTAVGSSMGMGLDQSLMSTISRRDGQQQVTYAGKPLYYFQQDAGAGQAAGHGVNAHGGDWYLVGSNGQQVAAQPAS